MSVGSPSQLMTLSEFLDLPERRVERMLIRGKLWERKMTYRNPWQSSVLARLTFLLQRWFLGQSTVRGTVVVGDAGFRLSKDPDSVVGVDAGFAVQGTPLFPARATSSVRWPAAVGLRGAVPVGSDRRH
jgi:hypothetical protein